MNRAILFIVGLLAACMGTPALALTPPGWTARDGDRAVLDAAHPEKGMVLEFRIEDAKGAPEEVVSALQKKGVTIDRFKVGPNGHINLVGEEHSGRAKVNWASPTVAVWFAVIASSERVKSLDPGARLSPYALLMSLQAATDCEIRPAWWTKEARIIRQNPDPWLFWCGEDELKLKLNSMRESLKFNFTRESAATATATATATTMGTAGGILGGYIGGATVCEVAGFGGGTMGLDCLINPVVLSGTVLTGLRGGYLGYKNNKTVVTLGGALTGTGVGMALWLPTNYETILIPTVLLSAGVGGYLGRRLWRTRAAHGARYSLSPYWHQERSGLMVSGQF